MIALNDDCIGLRGSVVIVGRCAYEVGEREIGLAVAEAVVEEGYLLTVERTGTSEPVEHLKADILIRRIGAEGKDGQSRRLKRCVKARLWERLHFGKALGQRSEGELLSLIAYRLYGRGRRLLRRAARHGRMLGISRPFLVELVETVIQSSESAYPELREHDAYIKKVIGTEEANFARTIDAGMNILNNMIDGLEKAHQHLLKGLDVFKLNDTFGFPLDLTKEIAAEQGLEIDEEGFHAEMKKQKERARAERLKKNISGWSEDLFGALDAEEELLV